jgi:hypothetical protein
MLGKLPGRQCSSYDSDRQSHGLSQLNRQHAQFADNSDGSCLGPHGKQPDHSETDGSVLRGGSGRFSP